MWRGLGPEGSKGESGRGVGADFVLLAERGRVKNRSRLSREGQRCGFSPQI